MLSFMPNAIGCVRFLLNLKYIYKKVIDISPYLTSNTATLCKLQIDLEVTSMNAVKLLKALFKSQFAVHMT